MGYFGKLDSRSFVDGDDFPTLPPTLPEYYTF